MARAAANGARPNTPTQELRQWRDPPPCQFIRGVRARGGSAGCGLRRQQPLEQTPCAMSLVSRCTPHRCRQPGGVTLRSAKHFVRLVKRCQAPQRSVRPIEQPVNGDFAPHGDYRPHLRCYRLASARAALPRALQCAERRRSRVLSAACSARAAPIAVFTCFCSSGGGSTAFMPSD